MRLRFGRPSMLVLAFFAVIAAVTFYFLDNRSQEPVSPTPIVANQALIPTSTPVPGSLIEDPATGAIQIAGREPIAPDTTIFIPRAGIISTVIEAYLDGQSWDISQLRTNVGHLEGTSWIDEPGNVVLSGHVEMADGRPGVFANLSELVLDDLIVIKSDEREIQYVVTEKYITIPTDLTPLYPTDTERLTLITCDSYDFLSNSYLERMVIIAEPIG